MNQPASADTNDSGTPFGMDPDKPLKMKFSTLRAIVIVVALACLSGGGWAVNVKMSLNKQDERSSRIEEQVHSLAESVTKQTEALTKQTDALTEQRINLIRMDAKLDNITRQTK